MPSYIPYDPVLDRGQYRRQLYDMSSMPNRNADMWLQRKAMIEDENRAFNQDLKAQAAEMAKMRAERDQFKNENEMAKTTAELWANYGDQLGDMSRMNADGSFRVTDKTTGQEYVIPPQVAAQALKVSRNRSLAMQKLTDAKARSDQQTAVANDRMASQEKIAGIRTDSAERIASGRNQAYSERTAANNELKKQQFDKEMEFKNKVAEWDRQYKTANTVDKKRQLLFDMEKTLGAFQSDPLAKSNTKFINELSKMRDDVAADIKRSDEASTLEKRMDMAWDDQHMAQLVRGKGFANEASVNRVWAGAKRVFDAKARAGTPIGMSAALDEYLKTFSGDTAPQQAPSAPPPAQGQAVDKKTKWGLK